MFLHLCHHYFNNRSILLRFFVQLFNFQGFINRETTQTWSYLLFIQQYPDISLQLILPNLTFSRVFILKMELMIVLTSSAHGMNRCVVRYVKTFVLSSSASTETNISREHSSRSNHCCLNNFKSLTWSLLFFL